MKKTIFLILTLGLIALKSFSQEAFVLNKTYRQGWIVWYPSYGTFYISKPISFTATKTPNNDLTNWSRYYYPVPTTPTPTPTPVPQPVPPVTTAPSAEEVEKRLLFKIDSLSNRIKIIERLPLVFGSSFDVKQTDTAIIVNLKPIK